MHLKINKLGKGLFFIVVCCILILDVNCQDSSCVMKKLIDSVQIKELCNSKYDFIPFDYPVCGCDFMTYLNYNCANAHGVYQFISTDGGCNCIDSNLIVKSYVYELHGQSSKSVYPICGCNGQTYLHPNIAVYKHGITKWTPGPCNCIEKAFVDSSQTKYLREVQDERTRFGNKNLNFVCGCDSITYPSAEWAMWYAGAFNFKQGKCTCIDSSIVDLAFACDDVYDPVCGCDSITYYNSCIAEKHHGVVNYVEGECPCKDEFLKDTLLSGQVPVCPELLIPVCGCDSSTYYNACYAEKKFGIIHYRPGLCKCIDEEPRDTLINCSETYAPICACDGNTYLNYCKAINHHGVNKYGWHAGPCSCSSSALQDSTYDCNELSVVDRVCGCDSVTYINECVAMKYGGVTTWTKGWCTYNCVDSNLIDTIKFCATVYDPVCGCDSVTYTNECVAFYRSGMTSWTKGACFTKITEVNEDIELAIYPNPTNGMFNVDIQAKGQGYYRLDVLDQNGSLLMSRNYSNKSHKKMNIQGFPNGVYFVRVRTTEGHIVKKIVKY